MNTKILSTALGLFSIVSSQAATIVWDAGTTDVSTAGGFINAGSDANVSVSLNGAPVTATSTGALNVGTATPTINGVTFTATGAGSGPFGTFGSDADVQSVIHFHNAAAAYSLDFSGLKANTEYQIQILGIHDNRTASNTLFAMALIRKIITPRIPAKTNSKACSPVICAIGNRQRFHQHRPCPEGARHRPQIGGPTCPPG